MAASSFLGSTASIPKWHRRTHLVTFRAFPRRAPSLKSRFFVAGVESMLGGFFTADWRGKNGSVWEAYQRTCEPDSPARNLNATMLDQWKTMTLPSPSAPPGAAPDFAFLESADVHFDFCENPWAHNFFGHFFSDW